MNIKPMTRIVALALVAAVGLSFVATPAMAAGGTPLAVSARAGKGPLAVSADARLARLDTSAMAAQTSAASAGSEHKPFFKSGKGVAVILLFVGGTAWTIASANKDRIHSPNR